MTNITEQVTQTQANTGITGSGVLAGATWVVEVAPVLQIVATAAVIIVTLIAGWYKIECIREIRRKRRDDV